MDRVGKVPNPPKAKPTRKTIYVIGSGQPIHDGEELAGKRGDTLWKLDQKAPSSPAADAGEDLYTTAAPASILFRGRNS